MANSLQGRQRWKACITRTFSASHEVKGHPHGGLHGHDFEVTVCICVDELDEQGFVIDYYVLARIVDETVARLDHTHLNEALGVERATLEAVAQYVYKSVSRSLEGSREVCSVKVCGPKEFCVELYT